MTEHDLKEMKNLGAELGAAKAENERLREALRWYEEKVTECRKIGSLGDNARQALDLDGGFRARDAISQQPEPTDTYTAVDMATAAALGFRDGQAAVEPAPAQDEREAPTVVATAILGGLFHGGSGPELGEIDIEVCTPALETIQCETVNSSDDVFLPLMTVAQHERIVAALARPAQTEQQPVAIANKGEHAFWVKWTEAGKPLRGPGIKLYAAPIAQPAPQGKFAIGDLVKKSTGSEWVGRVVGWYSTEQTKEGYAVESEVHKDSVQIYPAKALELVPMAAKEA